MKKASLFRNLLWFPFISIVLFDATFKIEDKAYQVPHFHFIIVIGLVLLYLSSFLLKKQS